MRFACGLHHVKEETVPLIHWILAKFFYHNVFVIKL